LVGLVLAGVALLVGSGTCILIGGHAMTDVAIVTGCLGWLLICASQAMSALSRQRG
jgi:hypothetical protein